MSRFAALAAALLVVACGVKAPPRPPAPDREAPSPSPSPTPSPSGAQATP